MDENIGVMLKCRVCLGEYNDSTQRPLLLPACGHTFCSMCLKMLQTQGNVGCPECRKINAVSSVDQLPVNFSVLSLAQALNKSISQNQMQASSLTASNISSDPLCVNFDNIQSSQIQNKTSNLSKRQTVSSKNSSQLYNTKQDSSLSYEKATNKPQFKEMSQNMCTFGTAAISNNSSADNNLHSNQPGSSRASHNITQSTSSSQKNKISMDQKKSSELQEELDFQMAIHLTFCKDPNHKHDDPLSPSSGICDNLDISEEEQLKLALQMSRDELLKN